MGGMDWSNGTQWSGQVGVVSYTMYVGLKLSCCVGVFTVCTLESYIIRMYVPVCACMCVRTMCILLSTV